MIHPNEKLILSRPTGSTWWESGIRHCPHKDVVRARLESANRKHRGFQRTAIKAENYKRKILRAKKNWRGTERPLVKEIRKEFEYMELNKLLTAERGQRTPQSAIQTVAQTNWLLQCFEFLRTPFSQIHNPSTKHETILGRQAGLSYMPCSHITSSLNIR